jgi:hypothetical protein
MPRVSFHRPAIAERGEQHVPARDAGGVEDADAAARHRARPVVRVPLVQV